MTFITQRLYRKILPSPFNPIRRSHSVMKPCLICFKSAINFSSNTCQEFTHKYAYPLVISYYVRHGLGQLDSNLPQSRLHTMEKNIERMHLKAYVSFENRYSPGESIVIFVLSPSSRIRGISIFIKYMVHNLTIEVRV